MGCRGQAGSLDNRADLNSIITGNGLNPFYAHYALAFDLYRDRMKETGKAQEATRRLIREAPHSWWRLGKEP